MRAIQNPDHPARGIDRDQWLRENGPGMVVRRCDMQHIPCHQCPSGMSSKLAERKGGLTAQIVWHLKPSPHREIGPATGTLNPSNMKQ